ncbi:MAG: C-type lectin domain protein [Pedosphaera sp.]|nr:C-type lectin domain protein [Pedosphaera sp.]
MRAILKFKPAAGALTIVVCWLALTASADVSKQATWEVVAGGNGHTYRVVAKSSLISWDSANVAAVAAGGYLATITSAAENSFVFSLVNDPTYWTQTANGHGPWIGGYQPTGAGEPNGGWTWATRTGLTTPEPFSFTNWEVGEPNNLTATVSGVAHNQDRVAYFHSGNGRAATWSDEFNLTGASLNQWTMSYVIEFSGTPPILANPRSLPDGSFQFTFTNRPGAFFEVLTTTNLALPLTNWTLSGSATEVSPGQFQFTDMPPTNSLPRFYRVRTP